MIFRMCMVIGIVLFVPIIDALYHYILEFFWLDQFMHKPNLKAIISKSGFHKGKMFARKLLDYNFTYVSLYLSCLVVYSALCVDDVIKNKYTVTNKRQCF